jgi:ATP-binding cassette, subfamily A (ABC1), member 3
MFLLYLIALLSVFTYAPVQKIDSDVLYVHFTIAAITPVGNLARALFVALNVFQTSYNGDSLSTQPGDIKLYRGPILYLALQSVALFGMLL